MKSERKLKKVERLLKKYSDICACQVSESIRRLSPEMIEKLTAEMLADIASAINKAMTDGHAIGCEEADK